MKRFVIAGAIASVLVAACQTPTSTPNAVSTPADTLRSHVAIEIGGIDAMRIGLAGTIGSESVDAETFARVCKPVGQRAAALAQSTGWEVRQMAVKYRNPANAADSLAADAIHRFTERPGIDTLWVRDARAGVPGWRYLQRIEVEPTCLACHGARDSRPAFVQEKYADDRAYDFDAGDVRGVYSVFVAMPR